MVSWKRLMGIFVETVARTKGCTLAPGFWIAMPGLRSVASVEADLPTAHIEVRASERILQGDQTEPKHDHKETATATGTLQTCSSSARVPALLYLCFPGPVVVSRLERSDLMLGSGAVRAKEHWAQSFSQLSIPALSCHRL